MMQKERQFLLVAGSMSCDLGTLLCSLVLSLSSLLTLARLLLFLLPLCLQFVILNFSSTLYSQINVSAAWTFVGCMADDKRKPRDSRRKATCESEWSFHRGY